MPVAGHAVILAEITMAEVAAALAAKQRAPNGFTLQERDAALGLFSLHCQTQYQLIAINRAVIDRAVCLTRVHKLRGYDAVQLAAALLTDEALLNAALPGLIFVAADGDLLAAANTEGLITDNPNQHP